MPGQLLRETNPAQGFAPSLVPQHEDVNGDYKATGEKNPLPVSIEDSGGAAQVDVQYRKQKTLMNILTGVSVAPTAQSTESEWIDTDGFNDIGITVVNDVNNKSFGAMIKWSHDKVTQHSGDYIVTNNMPTTTSGRGNVVPTQARYCKVTAYNGDAVIHVMSVHGYLKV